MCGCVHVLLPLCVFLNEAVLDEAVHVERAVAPPGLLPIAYCLLPIATSVVDCIVDGTYCM